MPNAETNEVECYVIAEGGGSVTIRGELVRNVSEDDVVGERGVLEDRARTAMVTATTHVNAWAISRERLLALLERSPTAKRAMLDYTEQRYGAESCQSSQ
jgi:CRP-like cAMP-binding protein